jgi:hypothetical protein
MPKLLAIVLAKSPKLLLKLSWRYLKIKKQAQRAEKAFRRRLEASGMDHETATRLAEKYSSTVSLRHMMKELGIPGSVFGNGKK